MVKAMYRQHSLAPAQTDIKEFPGRSHWLIAEEGWQEVAEFALAWAEENSAAPTQSA